MDAVRRRKNNIIFWYYIVKMIQMDTLDDFDFEIKDISTSSNTKTTGIDDWKENCKRPFMRMKIGKKRRTILDLWTL